MLNLLFKCVFFGFYNWVANIGESSPSHLGLPARENDMHLSHLMNNKQRFPQTLLA